MISSNGVLKPMEVLSSRAGDHSHQSKTKRVRASMHGVMIAKTVVECVDLSRRTHISLHIQLWSCPPVPLATPMNVLNVPREEGWYAWRALPKLPCVHLVDPWMLALRTLRDIGRRSVGRRCMSDSLHSSDIAWKPNNEGWWVRWLHYRRCSRTSLSKNRRTPKVLSQLQQERY